MYAAADSYHWPAPLVPALWTLIFTFDGNGLLPPMLSKYYLPGLNKRLDPSNEGSLDLAAIVNECDKRNISLWDLVIMPEQDDWTYKATNGPSIVCSGLVVRLLKAGGVFGDIAPSIMAEEFTPKDVYQLQTWDARFFEGYECGRDSNGRVTGYCQLFGTYDFEMPGFNSIAPYPHMDEKCSYERTPGC